MEAALKRRVLYLEQYKLAAGSKMAHIQARLDLSVPVADYTQLQNELDDLRENHLIATRCVEGGGWRGKGG
jgi:hypothetical protein